MAMPSSTSSGSGALFRIIAVAVLFLSITAAGLQVLGALAAMDQKDPPNLVPLPTLFCPPLISIVVGIALATMLEGIARLVSREETTREDDTGRINVVTTIAQLQNTLPPLVAEAVIEAILQNPPAADPNAALDPNVQEHLQKMVKLLEEMKELSMLDESQRQTRRKQIAQRRKDSRLEEASNLMHQGKWAEADALLHLLESLHPGDTEVLASRNQLDDARILHQSTDWEKLSLQVTDLLALSQYGPALTATNQFLEQYPTNTDGRQLALRIMQEERAYTDSTSGRLYDQIKTHVENRQWRTALDGIQEFLERYPTNPRAEKIRKQIRVIQKNAEIEERHEQESRIKELIANNKFNEAADLSEDLLQRFPDSPQAAYLSELLPKLRDRSMAEEDGAVTN